MTNGKKNDYERVDGGDIREGNRNKVKKESNEHLHH